MVTHAREKHDVPRSTSATTPAVDTTDWLKTAAIIFVSIDHFGYFFVDDEGWWSTFARLGAPPFFFLVGYAKSRTVPLYWIWLGVILTVLDSWNADWTWVAPNILLSFALIRIARPYVNSLVQYYGWGAFAFVVFALLVVVPPAEKLVDYGSRRCAGVPGRSLRRKPASLAARPPPDAERGRKSDRVSSLPY